MEGRNQDLPSFDFALRSSQEGDSLTTLTVPEQSRRKACPEPYGSGLVEPPICCSPTNYNSWFLRGEYLEGGFSAFKNEIWEIIKKQAPIVCWYFEIEM